VNPALLPLAVTCTVLYLGMGLLPFAPAGIVWGEALALLPERLFAQGIPQLPLLLMLPLGVFWQGVVWPQAASTRLAAAAAVFLGLGLLAMLLQLGQLYFPPKLALPGGLLVPLLGVAAGMALWWLFGPLLSRRLPLFLPPLSTWLWPLLVVSAAFSVLLPLNLEAPLGAPALAGSAYFSEIPQRFYLLIKSAILWAPVGFLYAMSGHGVALPRWGIALVVAWLLEGVPLLYGQPLAEGLELLFALPGLWVGNWLGARSLPHWAPAALPGATRREAAVPEPRASLAEHVSGTPAGASAPDGKSAARHHTRRHRHSSHPSHSSRPRSGRRLPRGIVGSLLLLAAGIGLAAFPLWQWGLGLGLALYMAALWRWPLAWLVVVPAALPLLDLAPWSGRFFFDEFDLLMLATAGTLLLRGRRTPGSGLNSLWPLFALCAVSVLISLALGLGSPPPLDANAFSSYWSPYNSLRVAKGFAWGGLIFLLLRLARPEPAQLATRLAIGMGIGLLGVGLVGLWEHWLFAGFANDSNTYRIVSTFSSMHTGGGHIEAYLAAALPFLWLGWKTRLWVVPVMALTVSATVFTVARGGVLALGVVLFTLAVASLRLAWRAGQRRQAVLPIGVLALMALGLLAGIGGGYFQQRLAQAGEDWDIRVEHWRSTVAMMDATPMAQLFGMGLGSFPRVYLERGPADKQPATFGFVVENDNPFLRLGHGETLYYAQRVSVRAGQRYHLELDVRSQQPGARIETPVCEKQLLNSRRCVWMAFEVPTDGRWHRLSRDFSSGQVGAEDGLQRPAVELALYYPGNDGLIDVDNVRLLAANGGNLIGNGGFTWGGDYWFFKTHSHLPWHIKNVWVQLLFEQGWLGLSLFSLLAAFALARLAKAAWSGQALAWAWLASLLGLFTVGLFDSLLDAPRLATLLIALCLLGAGHEWNSKPSHRHRSRRSPHPGEAADLLDTAAENFSQASTPSAR